MKGRTMVWGFVFAACASVEEGGDIEGIVIQPAEAVLLVGDTAQFGAVALREDGTPHEEELRLRWSTRDPEIATISAEGVVEGRSLGETLIRAEAGGHFAEASARVEAPLDVEIEISDWTSDWVKPIGERGLVLEVDQHRVLGASASPPGGPRLGSIDFVWSVSDPSVSEILPSTPAPRLRELRAVGPGNAMLRVAWGPSAVEVEVTVLPRPQALEIDVPAQIVVGERHPLVARTLDEEGLPIREVSVVWSSSDPAVLAVDGDEVAALKAGQAILKGALGQLEAERSMQVLP